LVSGKDLPHEHATEEHHSPYRHLFEADERTVSDEKSG
jgi:hypothetical protein